MLRKIEWPGFAMVLCLIFAVVLALGAQTPAPQSGTPAPPPAQTPPAGQGAPATNVLTAGQSPQFKNIKVLKDIPAEQLIPSMLFITAALGTDCDFCHVGDTNGQHNFDKDDKRPKQTARQMMEMTRNINQASFGGRNQVNCATCHQGHTEPVPVPPVMDEARLKERRAAEAARREQQQAQATPPAPAANAGTPGAPPANAGAQPGQPATPAPAPAQQGPNAQAMQAAADQLFAKYEQAIGGDAAMQRFSSRTLAGTLVTNNGTPLKLSVEEKAPNKRLVVVTLPNGNMSRVGYDGSTAWQAFGSNVGPLQGLELAVFKLSSDFLYNWKLKNQCARAFAQFRKEPINGRDANVVRCMVPGNQIIEIFYFDPDSGLLLRRNTAYRSALGPIMQQTDYSDYRDVDGIKIPFTIHQARPDSFSTVTLSEVKMNAPVNDGDFAMPKPAENKPTGQ